MSDFTFYVLEDLLFYNISRSKELTPDEKDNLIRKVYKGTISVDDILYFGKQPTEPIEEQYLPDNLVCYNNQNSYSDDEDDDYHRRQEEEERRLRDEEYERLDDEINLLNEVMIIELSTNNSYWD